MDIKKAKLVLNPNYNLIPVSELDMTEENAEYFNSIYESVKDYNKINRTNSGGISIQNLVYPAYDIRNTSSCVELTVLESDGMYRIQFRNKSNANKFGITGHKAFNRFKKMLLTDGVNLDDYKIDNGEAVKALIEKPYIKFENDSFADMVFENVHHIDFHNSYPAGLCNTHPEFRPTVERLYEKRKTNDIYKAILNLSIGYMQSLHCCKAKWAQLSKDAIADNNRRIEDIADRLRNSGRMIISYNTDGIWYIGDIYHGEGEGDKLGQWHNDHTNCKFRAKSPGSYEYIEDGKYYPVVRGLTRLDKKKPRTEWQWGDIYNDDCNVIKFVLTELGLETVEEIYG